MMQLLPTEILDWVNPKDFNLDNYSNKSQIGCFLEVDMIILTKYMIYFSLAGRKIKVIEEMSKYQLQVIEDKFSLGKKKTYS